jgi:hypothetical protein
VVALLLLGGAALGAEPAGPRQDPLVARVNGHELRLSQVYDSIENLSLGDQIDVRSELETYVEAMVNEEVLFQWAMANDFRGEETLREEVKHQVVSYLIEKYVRSRIHVDDAAVRAYYDTNPSLVRGEHVRVRRIVLRERAQCEALLGRIASEEQFAREARARSLEKETAAQGGDAGLMMRGEGSRTGYELEFFDMQVGEMRIFDLPGGCVLVRSVFYTNPPLPPFEAVRDDIRRFLETRQEVALIENLFRGARQDIPVERHYSSLPDTLPDFLPGKPDQRPAR